MEDGKKVLRLKLKELCGKKFYYPENETASLVLSLCKTTTGRRKALTSNDLETLKELGFDFVILRPRTVYNEE